MNEFAVVNQDNLRVLLPSKIALTIDEVARARGTDPTQEIAEFYGSEVYRRLEREATKYWCFSPAELCDIYLQGTASPLG